MSTILFKDWAIYVINDASVHQFDNGTQTLTVTGDLPEGWDLVALISAGPYMDYLPLHATSDGVEAVLTREHLSYSGVYVVQLRGTNGDLVKHTNTVSMPVSASLSGDAHWPKIPSEFTEIERRIAEKATLAEEYTAHPPIHGDNGNWWLWDGEAYADSGKPYTGEPGADGKDGADGADGYTPVKGVDYFDGADGKDGKTPVKGVDYFDGADGTPGKDGTDGQTPQRGVDYYTPEDVEAIVADATSRVEASFGGTYELVEEITTTEDLTQIDRTTWPDGTKYNFKEMVVKCVYEVAAGTSGQVNVTFQNRTGSQWTTLGTTSGQVLNTKRYYHWNHCYKRYGFWNAQHGYSSSVYASAVYQMAGYAAVINDLNIDALNIKATNSTIPLPAGTTIRIYGVRA